MPHLPQLRVVPLESIRRHEEVDPLRVERLVGRIEAEGIQVNPMVCYEAPGNELILLDGATRTESMKHLGLEHAVVQIAAPDGVRLETWHHLVRGTDPEEVMLAITDRDELSLSDDGGTPRIHLHEDGARTIRGDGVSPNAALSSLVGSYVGRWKITRIVDPGLALLSRTFPDWAALIEFPTLSLDDVIEAAVTDDLLPAGITRFLIHERALRVNIPLELLAGARPIESKQQDLDDLIEQRSRSGRIRRYEETVFILDE